MTIFEAIVFNRELLARLDALGIRPADAAYVDLFADFCKMVNNGDKVSYAVAVLSERYGVCERKVYTLLKRFRSPCGGAIFGGGVNVSLAPRRACTGLKRALCAVYTAFAPQRASRLALSSYLCAVTNIIFCLWLLTSITKSSNASSPRAFTSLTERGTSDALRTSRCRCPRLTSSKSSRGTA